jgi:hypothetical protein
MNLKVSKLVYYLKLHRLIVLGLFLLAIALAIDKHDIVSWGFFATLLGEVGALLVVVGTLHWMFEHGSKQALLKDVLSSILAGERILQNGLVDCYSN